MEPAREYRPSYNPAFVREVLRKREAARSEAIRLEGKRRQHETVRNAIHVVDVPEYRAIVVRALPSGKKIIRDMISAVAASHGLTYEDIIGDRRTRIIVQARHEAVRVVADARPDMSIASLARMFNRDHTTLLSALKKTRKPGSSR